MIQKISSFKKKKILICIHDITDSCESRVAEEIAVNLTDYMISRFINNGFDVLVGKDEDELISEAVNEDFYTHAVMIASGTSMKLSERLITEIEQKCQESFFLAGHLLDRNDSYFELHHQFYIINLAEFISINRPIIGKEEDVIHAQIEPLQSEEKVDSYIPVYIKQGTSVRTYTKKMHGWNIISEGLKFNKTLVDIGYGLRNNKKYFYYEYDHVFIKESADLVYNQFFFNNFVVPLNSDHLNKSIDFDGPVDQYITVGTGLNWIKNLKLLGFHKDTTVIFADNNPLVINFMKKLVSNWDGKDYMDFYLKNQINDLPNNLPYDHASYIRYNESLWQSFLQEFDDWEDLWMRVKTLNFKFVSIDYMSNYNLEWIEKNKKTFFNVSDVFEHVPNVFLLGIKYRLACENRLIHNLRNIDENIWLNFTARTMDSFAKDMQISFQGKVKDLPLIDINEIKNKPYWHERDWRSLRILM